MASLRDPFVRNYHRQLMTDKTQYHTTLWGRIVLKNCAADGDLMTIFTSKEEYKEVKRDFWLLLKLFLFTDCNEIYPIFYVQNVRTCNQSNLLPSIFPKEISRKFNASTLLQLKNCVPTGERSGTSLRLTYREQRALNLSVDKISILFHFY